MTAVIFDVGGVLINWDPRYLYRTLFDGDDAAMERFLAEVCTPDWNRRLDAGLPFADGVAELIARFPEHAGLIAAYDLRWEEMVPGALSGTIAVVEALYAAGVRLYALTNFSAEKFPLVRRRFDVFALFDGFVVSGEVGLVKPDPGIYRHLLRRFDLEPASCLFIDDVAANVEGARAVGLRAEPFRGAEALRADLERYAIL
ncbi:MAG: HAD family phosphatase [Rhodospirillales bacterium]|nr:HAD family phosphatase [Rhodospirillales bacterium]